MDLQIRQAEPDDAPAVTAILIEAARWVEQLDGTTMWVEGERAADRVEVEHYLRLDCDNERSRLRALYERFGFRLHSVRQVGAYFVARYELPLRWH